MLDQLGIHVDYVESEKWMYCAWRERGRGSEHIFIQLADDLSLADQVTYLARAWTGLLPAAEHRWCTPWTIDEDDPEMEWRSFWWPRQS